MATTKKTEVKEESKQAEVKQEEPKQKKFKVVSPIKGYCGVGAGGVHFSYGEAEVNEGWVCDWYKEKGYKVEEIEGE